MDRSLPSAEGPELSIVVMFTHDPGLARACLGSIAREAPAMPAAETIVVLNCASDAVRDVVSKEFSGAKVIESSVNTGTAVAWQLGFTLARGEFVLLMHEDAQLLENTLPPLLAALRAEDAAAVAGPWLDESGANRAGVNAGGLRFGGQSLVLSPEHLPQDIAEPYAVEEVSSATSLWRSSAWEEIGGFEERTYPAISVEAVSFAALCARGYCALVVPEARGLHISGTMNSAPTLLSGPHIRHYLGSRFNRLWAEKWAPRAEWFVDLAAHGWSSDPVPQEAIDLALSGAEQRRRERPTIDDPPRAEHPITNPNGGPAPTEITPEIAERLAAAEREVIDGYTRWLIDRDIEMTRRYEEAYAAYLAESEKSAELRAALQRAGSNPLRRIAARLTRRS